MTTSKIKEDLSSMIIMQQNFVKILLTFIEKIVSSSSNVDSNHSDSVLKLLEDLKKSLNYCNENISSLQKTIENISEENDYQAEYLSTISLVNKNTIFIEDFIYSTLPFCELKFSNNEIKTSKENSTKTTNPGLDAAELKEDTLIISETTGKVILPYKLNELENIKQNHPEQTYKQIIDEHYSLPISLFKTPFIARFREAFKLARIKEKKSVKTAFDLGTELLFNYNLHPAIIAGCRNLDELDIYLDYLENNETEKFNCFQIVFEIPPIMSKKRN